MVAAAPSPSAPVPVASEAVTAVVPEAPTADVDSGKIIPSSSTSSRVIFAVGTTNPVKLKAVRDAWEKGYLPKLTTKWEKEASSVKNKRDAETGGGKKPSLALVKEEVRKLLAQVRRAQGRLQVGQRGRQEQKKDEGQPPREYAFRACSVKSGVSEQPMSLPEIVRGAKNRAEAAFEEHSEEMEPEVQQMEQRKQGKNCARTVVLGVGIESGLHRLGDVGVVGEGEGDHSDGVEEAAAPATTSTAGWYDQCVVSVYDGRTREHHLGVSCGFEIPAKAMESLLVSKCAKDLSQACHLAGLTAKKNLGENEGLIGVLTKGVIDRTDYTKQAVVTALWKFVDEVAADGG